MPTMPQHDYSAKSIFWLLINATLVLVMVFALIGIGTMVRYSNAIVPSRTITVTGEGKTQITPNIATDSFSVITQGSDASVIQQENTAKMNAAIEFLKTQGVKTEDIKTTGYNLYPRYNYGKDGGTAKIDGYELTQTVSFKIRDLTKVGAILSGVVKAGVNQMGSLSYSVENPELQRSVAREQAFNDAYMKASAMAAQNGVQLARVITFSESGGDRPMYYDKVMSAAVPMGGGAVPMLEPGTQETIVSVAVTYELR